MTSAANSGTGTLRAALESTQAYWIVFDLGAIPSSFPSRDLWLNHVELFNGGDGLCKLVEGDAGPLSAGRLARPGLDDLLHAE